MAECFEEDVNRALMRVYQKNKQEQQKQYSSHQKKETDDERRKAAYQEAEEIFLSHKIAEPCAVKEIYPFPLTKKQEDFLIPEFIAHTHGLLPTDHTMAMEGNPYTVLVQMENGLVYMAAISQDMHICWPGGLAGEIYRKMEKASDGLIHFKGDWRPIILADTRHYHIQLYPMHLNKDIQEHDSLGILWQPTEDITDPKIRPGLVYPGGGKSFRSLTDPYDGLMIVAIPAHIRKMVKQVQAVYDQARAEKKIGKPIYARLDPDKPPAGRGWTIPIWPWERRQYFDVPALRFVNPNRKSPLQIVNIKPHPKRLVIDRTSLGLKRDTHE